MTKHAISCILLLLTSLLFAGCGNAPAAKDEPVSETHIALGETVTITGQGAAANGQQITISEGGVYVLTGTLSNGQVLVDCADAVTLQLANVSITNAQGPAILIKQSSDAQIFLADGSENTLSDSASADYDAALYSCVSLTLGGSGCLTVTGNYQEGIASNENITINGGTYLITAADDGINASHDGASVITINDGCLTITAEGDGIDSNGSLVINGGTIITMSALTDMSGGIDTDGDFIINGGTLLATGARNTLPSDQSDQAALSLNFKSTQAAGTPLQILSDEQLLLTAVPQKAYQTLLYSSSSLTDDGCYSIYAGGTSETAKEILLTSRAVFEDSIQQTHRDAAAAGEFLATGSLTTFAMVTYLTDTDFTAAFQQNGRPDGQEPPQQPQGSPGSARPTGERPQRPADGQGPAHGQPPADDNTSSLPAQ